MFSKILLALILFGLGYLLLQKTKAIYDMTGNFAWAEKYIGSGWTVVLIRLIGVFLLVLALLAPFGALDGLFVTPWVATN